MAVGVVDAEEDPSDRAMGEFWSRVGADGPLPRSADLEWLTETGTLLAHAETYLLLAKTAGWDSDR